jgi:AcrR family transcriptional regulator
MTCPVQCRVCLHPRRTDIEAAIVSGRSVRSIAAEFGISRSSVNRHHLDKHINRTLQKAAGSPLCPPARREEIQALAQSEDLIRYLKGLLGKAVSILNQAESAGDLRTALHGIHEARASIETLAKITGEMNTGIMNQTINAGISPDDYNRTVSAVIKALEAYPEARHSVLTALQGIKVIECTIQ